jgi:outer membrane immunogenic protein
MEATMRMMTAAVCFVIVGAHGAIAQQAPSTNWQGAYVGGFGGALFGHGEIVSLSNTTTKSTSSEKAVGGAFGGYNWQFGSLVIGAETDWTRIADSSHDLFTLRGRAGWAFGNSMLYATVGAGTQTATITRLATGQEVEQRHTGVIAGGGFETMLASNLSLRIEGLTFNPGKEQYDFAASGLNGPSSATFDFHRTFVRAGISYHFN